MAINDDGPAGTNRGAGYKLRWTLSILPGSDPKCILRRLALVYDEALGSDDPRVTRLGLQVIWREVEAILGGGRVSAAARGAGTRLMRRKKTYAEEREPRGGEPRGQLRQSSLNHCTVLYYRGREVQLR
jgi:hypothetical protein